MAGAYLNSAGAIFNLLGLDIAQLGFDNTMLPTEEEVEVFAVAQTDCTCGLDYPGFARLGLQTFGPAAAPFPTYAAPHAAHAPHALISYRA